MLQELGKQTLLERHDCEVIVLENGSRDQTAAVARTVLSTALPAHVSHHVLALPIAGKSRIWNSFVHDISNDQSEYLIFLDADIRFVGNEGLTEVINKLATTPKAEVSVDYALKSTAIDGTKGIRDKLSLAASCMTHNGPVAITGQLYCDRASTMRRYHLPNGLLVEDGFVKAMVATDGFTKDADETRIVRAPNAAHLFEPVTSLPDVFRHEVGLAIGTEVNIALFDHLRALQISGANPSTFIAEQNQQNPNWVTKLIAEKRKRSELPFHAWEYALKPWRQFCHPSASKSPALIPIVGLKVLFNGAAALAAQRALRIGRWSW